MAEVDDIVKDSPPVVNAEDDVEKFLTTSDDKSEKRLVDAPRPSPDDVPLPPLIGKDEVEADAGKDAPEAFFAGTWGDEKCPLECGGRGGL